MINELVTKEDFRQAMRANKLIVITDQGGSPRIHPGGCEHIEFESFQQKVLKHGGKNGGYFAVGSRSEAEHRWPGLADCYGWT